MAFYFNHYYRYNIVKDIVYDSIMSCDVSRIGYIISTFHSFWMSYTLTRCFRYTIQYLSQFFEKRLIRLLPFFDDLFRLFRVINLIHHRASSH